MSNRIEIDVRHVTRVEGHGNVRVRATDGTIEEIQWQVPEAPRFFEAMCRGRNWEDVQTVVSRICGICSVTHSLAAIKAVESAFGTEVSTQTDRLRILTHYGEQIESHVLHVGYLVAPDLLGARSVIPLVNSHAEVVKTVIALHKLGNEIMESLAGRKTHPIRLKPGGFARLPTMRQLEQMRADLQAAVPRLEQLAGVIADLAGGLPDFRRETEYVALVNPPGYPFYHGSIGSSDVDKTVPVDQFEQVANEYVSPHSTAKWARWHRDSYFVGALARFNLNADCLQPLAAKTAQALGLKKGCTNPYWNNVAQLVETVQVVERSMNLIDELLDAGIRPERPQVRPRAGVGVGCVEAPRGILFHRYEFDEAGRCQGANICIPTGQNHGSIQADFEALVPTIIHEDQEVIRQKMEMLVRAYDPCISCSTHYLDVEFVSSMSAGIAIFGLGNPLMSDEGVGIRVLETLERSGDLPSGVELIELGTGGLRLLHRIEGRRKLIFVDCARMGEEAGALRRFRPSEVRSKKARFRQSLHEGDLLTTLELAQGLGRLPEDVVIFGIEPTRVEPGLELSPALATRLGEYAEQVLREASGTNPPPA